MFIYILGKGGYNDSYYDLEDVVEIATTDIQNILNRLSLDKMKYTSMTDYTILIKIDGEDYYEDLCVSKTMHKRLIEYPSAKLLEYEEEYDDMKNKIVKWCENISVQLEEEKKSKEEADRLKKEQKERALYEELKRKYGNE